MSPPRLSEARKLATLPAVKARILNRDRWNIGWGTRVSMTPKATRVARPPKISAMTTGLVHPMVCPP